MAKVIQDLHSVSQFLYKTRLLSIIWQMSGPGSLVMTSSCVFLAGSGHDTELESVLGDFSSLTKLDEPFSLIERYVATMIMFALSNTAIFSYVSGKMHSQLQGAGRLWHQFLIDL